MNKQAGMTLIGMILTMVIIVIAGIVVMRIVPVYIEYYSITKSIDSLETLPETDFSQDPGMNAQVLQTKLVNQLYVNGIEIPKEKIAITPIENGKFRIAVTYQVKKTLIGNMSLLFDFDISREVNVER